ncbi:hypothetical protein C805_03108 [Eubacterium sp. 14-2]|uniref:cysteine protease StiP family protein n=1 Tax=Eubacterium sp. 14-2 TaxID=1235790 RepID=UPI000339C04D|nr:cysteine protease StiP family protein [Eubacterium sp. 14-2]EOT23447.1 hypothetical protein C805_03108 [Eubacterium sp. 14-2]
MRSSYREDDVIFLLKDITGMVKPQPAREREKAIQAGRHYCEMLPLEYVPTQAYMEAYQEGLEQFAGLTAQAVGILADKIMEKKGSQAVLVSLARAGTPVGILLKRYIRRKYGAEVKHYSISIIRGRGIDANAMKFLLEKYEAESLLFVDGWIGKGAILGELKKELAAYPGVSDEIAVLADPAGVTELCGTHEDILIPSSCLNCTVSGLVSRTFLRDDIIGQEDFHGAVYYEEMEQEDLSYDFIGSIEQEFDFCLPAEESRSHSVSDVKSRTESAGLREVRAIGRKFGISDLNLIKPGIGETTRVLLRRIPWKILISSQCRKDRSLNHIVRLAEEKQVPVEYYPLVRYKSCGIIKKLADT